MASMPLDSFLSLFKLGLLYIYFCVFYSTIENKNLVQKNTFLHFSLLNKKTLLYYRADSVSFVKCFHQLGPLGRVGLVVAMSVCCHGVVPFPCDFFFKASHWPWYHKISSRPLIGQLPPPQKKNGDKQVLRCYYPHTSGESASSVCRI